MYLKDRKTKMKDQSQIFLQFLANQTQKQKTQTEIWTWSKRTQQLTVILVCFAQKIHNQSNLTLKQIKFINLRHENQPTTKSNLPKTQAILNKAISIQLLRLVSLNHIVWCYVWHYVQLNVVINKEFLLLSKIMVTWIFGHYHIAHEMHSIWFM